MGIEKTLDFSEDSQGAVHNLIGVFSAKKIVFLKHVARTALAVITGITEYGSPRSEMFVADLDENIDGNTSAKATLSKGSAKIRDKNAVSKAVAYCVPVELYPEK